MLDIDTAINAYREIGDASMVLSLERVRQHEDRNLLSAHIMVLLEKDYGQAQVRRRARQGEELCRRCRLETGMTAVKPSLHQQRPVCVIGDMRCLADC